LHKKDSQEAGGRAGAGPPWAQQEVLLKVLRMGSFFYGNDYGSNHMLFPYIASKLNRNILFPHSKFTH
jgi:hypothetical protein